MKPLFTGLAVLLLVTTTVAQNTKQDIERALTDYIQGTSYNLPNQIEKAFYKDANLYLDHKEKPLWIVPIAEYISWFKNGKQGEFNGRIGHILFVEHSKNIAVAKAEILIPNRNIRYVDLFLLKHINNQWQIISKAADSKASNLHGDKILFIVSNAHFYGDSELPTGNSYSEIVNAYDTFTNAGYSVDFVSPQGGAIPLAYINTSDALQKQYLYNTDFMYALEHTRKPSDITPEHYKAVHYIGGGSAMFGVPENKEIQDIVMQIYEEHNGIISSVCHGTAGIVHLKTKDGAYLVTGKTVNGYPDDFERTDAAYFKQFPFLIKKTIEDRGGTFKFSPRNTVHVEVEGNLITGQNYLSSKPVALAIIEKLQRSNQD